MFQKIRQHIAKFHSNTKGQIEHVFARFKSPLGKIGNLFTWLVNHFFICTWFPFFFSFCCFALCIAMWPTYIWLLTWPSFSCSLLSSSEHSALTLLLHHLASQSTSQSSIICHFLGKNSCAFLSLQIRSSWLHNGLSQLLKDHALYWVDCWSDVITGRAPIWGAVYQTWLAMCVDIIQVWYIAPKACQKWDLSIESEVTLSVTQN